MDAKDILGLPKTPFSSSQEKKSRPPKEPQRKPDGVSREVFLNPAPSRCCRPAMLIKSWRCRSMPSLEGWEWPRSCRPSRHRT